MGALAFFGWIMLARSKSRWARLRILIALAVVAVLVHVSLRFIRGFGMAELVDVVKEGNLLELFRASPAEQDISGGESAIAEYFVFAIDSAACTDGGGAWRCSQSTPIGEVERNGVVPVSASNSTQPSE